MSLTLVKPSPREERFTVWPEFQHEGEWSIPDAAWYHVWVSLTQSGRMWQVFYMGYVRTFEEFLGFMRSQGNYPMLIADKKTLMPVALAWCSHYQDGVCNAHFVFIQGLPHLEAGRMALEHWSTLPGICLILGLTPEHYTQAWKYAMKIGFTKVGVIPDLCPMHYENKRAPGVLTYYRVKKED